MTSESNKLLPILVPKTVIGTKRRPNRRDLYDRRDPSTRTPLQGLPDPSPAVSVHRAALELEQAALRMQQTILETTTPESAIRDSLVVLADPEAAGWSDSEWETVVDSESDVEEAIEEALMAELGEEGEEGVEDAFIAKVRGVGVGVEEVRGKRLRRNPMQQFVKKVRAVRQRGPIVTPAPAAVPARRKVAAAAPAAPIPRDVQPGTTRVMTAAEAALALTNEQAGTDVLMEELRAGGDIDDLDHYPDTYRWTVGKVATRELTIAEAALVLTNVQAGTNVTMEDLRTARKMVDLWDCEDTFVWTVGNVE